MNNPNMKPIIAIAMAEPVEPLSQEPRSREDIDRINAMGSMPPGSMESRGAYSIPNALRSMAVARERVAVQRFIHYLVENEHPFASDAFQQRRMLKLTRLMERMYGYDSEEVARELDGIRGKVK